MNGLTIDANGRVRSTISVPSGAAYVGGLAFNAGALCTTTTTGATDSYTNGMRVSATGQLVVTATYTGTPYVANGGLLFDKNTGAMITSTNASPAAADAYVNGARVSPTTGLYLYT